MQQVNTQRIRGGKRAKAIRPFHHNNALARIIPAQLKQGARPVQPPQVEMRDLCHRCIIDLHQGVGRAWHFHVRVGAQRAQQGACQRGFASTEIAFQQHGVTCRQQPRQGLTQSVGGSCVG